ncbi:hypothetical protein, partial [Porphyromonas loveana]
MKSEVLVVASILDGAGLSLSASALALSKIKQLEASTLTNKTQLISEINSALQTIQTKDANHEIDYSNPSAPEIVSFNNAMGAASTALENDKKTKLQGLQASQITLNDKVVAAEGKIGGLEAFKANQEAVNQGNQASIGSLSADMTVVKKKIIDNAVQYHYGNVIPTTSNEPASLWNTLEKCVEHEGDIYTIKVDAQSPESAQGLNMFQYKYHRTVKGDPTSPADFAWHEIGGGAYANLSVSVATLTQQVEENDSDEHFKEKVTANTVHIVDKVKEPTATLAAGKLKADQSFKQEVTPKINPTTGKWKNADGSDSDMYAAADKIPAFSAAVSTATAAAETANEKATLAQQKANAATLAAAEANTAKAQIIAAKEAGEFSAVRLYVDRVGDFRNGKVVGGVGGKVVLTPKWFVGGVEKPVQGSGKTVKWYKQNPAGSDILKKTVTATGSVDVRLLLS